jgi:hypothetical protein
MDIEGTDIRHNTTGCTNPKDHPHFDNNCHENSKILFLRREINLKTYPDLH